MQKIGSRLERLVLLSQTPLKSQRNRSKTVFARIPKEDDYRTGTKYTLITKYPGSGLCLISRVSEVLYGQTGYFLGKRENQKQNLLCVAGYSLRRCRACSTISLFDGVSPKQ